MSKITEAFKKNKAFIAFITGGDPDIETTEKLIIAMAKAGTDLIEIGIPFSDPVAEGIIIQDADERALKAGCTTDKLFEMVKRVRKKTGIPLLFMTYINPVFTYGKERFAKKCAECGINGIIIPDMPFEERYELLEEFNTNNIDLISMVAPTSEERIEVIAREAKGFIYCVSSLGVTGVRDIITTDMGKMIKKIREVTDTPCAIGFGISTPEQASVMANLSDGVIVGSAIVKVIAKYGRKSIKPVTDFVKSIKNGIRDGANKH
ncbi:MAG: tryptophan synthase subunit alpha [Actinomycetota bacterium]|nr:tryptophan synthase subunit alpha [Actinomycetota bacterium]